MARKSAKSTRRSSGRQAQPTGKVSTRSKLPSNSIPTRIAALFKRSQRSTPVTRVLPPAEAGRSSSTRARTTGPTSQPHIPAATTGLSLDRKLDIIGVVLVFIGLPTLLSLFSVNHSGATGSWLSFLSRVFGWGSYLFPLGLIVVGLWLILRNFERVPQVAVERVLGLVLLYLNLLTIFSFFTFPTTSQQAFDLARLGRGGGYAGAAILEFLQVNLGWGGAAVALLAWLLIALTLTLDVAVVDLFRWVPPLVLRLQDWWDERRNHLGDARKAPLAPATSRRAGEEALESPVQTHAPTVTAGLRPFPLPTGQPKVWVLPPVDEILESGGEVNYDDEFDRQRARVIEETLASFGAPVNVVEINRGPTITQFGVEPDFIETRTGRTRVRVGKIAALADDLALALSAKTIRVQAPVPGKGYVGIEVPNDEIALVALRDVIESEAFTRLKSPLRFALGQDVAGNAAAADLSIMPHLLIAGATGSGKSVCVNAIICCLLLNNIPDDLRLIMVDPKRVELTGYNGVPHLLAPVVVETERVVGALQWVLREMDQRYHKLAQAGTRNISEYNAKLVAHGEKKLPRLVVVIDELADLMILAPDETERTITRLAQLARATGIHLVIATQRPSVDVVTGLIKANFPARVAFAVASGVDSRVILDQPGAERLLGRGDMLFQAPDAAAPIRLQGAFVSDNEIQRLVTYWRSAAGITEPGPTAIGGVVDALPAGVPLKQMPLWDDMMPEEDVDPLLNESIDLVRRQGRASISMLQRRLRIGYTRAARLIETMQEKGTISTEAGPQGFEVLDYGPAAPPVEEQ